MKEMQACTREPGIACKWATVQTEACADLRGAHIDYSARS
jgi:hypothetical protein